jgi:hypothetical protein
LAVAGDSIASTRRRAEPRLRPHFFGLQQEFFKNRAPLDERGTPRAFACDCSCSTQLVLASTTCPHASRTKPLVEIIEHRES